MLALWIFCSSAALLAYVFLVYPSFILLLGTLIKREFKPRWKDLPNVTMILSALNEAETIAQKIENALSQDYPEDKLDLIIVDDGSTDNTSHVVKSFASPRLKLVEKTQTGGKTAALNLAVQQARGEVIVFTDANAMYQKTAVKHLVEAFDEAGKIGIVCGELKYTQHPQAVSDEESRYWNMEIRLKKAESNLWTLLGANGSIYAMRRELYEPLSEDIISDFIGPLLLSKRGYRTVYQPKAVSIEKSTRSLESEFRRKRRIVQRSLYGLKIHKELLNPLKTGFLAIQLWSHKVLRWLTPIWFFGIFIGCLLLSENPVFFLLTGLQLLGYLGGLIGIVLHALNIKPGILTLPAYIVMTLAAAFIGVTGVIMGKKVVTWNPQR